VCAAAVRLDAADKRDLLYSASCLLYSLEYAPETHLSLG